MGTAGKVVSLLSSIDSPVATWMVGRHGATVIPVHFRTTPTADTGEYLCQDIIGTLEGAGIVGRLYVVPFGERRAISLTVPQSLRIIMYRRVMYRVSERIAQIEGASAPCNGRVSWTGCLSNLGQYCCGQRIGNHPNLLGSHWFR